MSVGTPPAGASHSSYSTALTTGLQVNVTRAFDVAALFSGETWAGRPRLAQFCAGRMVKARCCDSCDAQPSNSVSTHQRNEPGGMVSVSDVPRVVPRTCGGAPLGSI